jgi:LysM repeat protein
VDDVAPEVRQLLNQAEQAEKSGRLVDARTALNTLLQNAQFREHDKDGVRRQLAELNQTLLFSPVVTPGDPLTETYKIASGDSLVKLAKKGLAVEADLLQRVNKISDPGKLRIGQSVKLVHGPFHLVVHKADFRADMYAGSPLPANSAGSPRADGSEPGWTYIRSFDVGLGEKSSTPTGTFMVRQGSKLKDPPWTNPRTGEKFASSDPKNPIGEHWLGLQGLDEKTKTVTGYGVHGTIAPESIGKEMSMGCVRLLPEDIALVWEMMQGGVSVVRIMP